MDKKSIDAIALSVRSLTMDAVQKANSGHPGMPMGVAELGALLYGEILKLNPNVPDWIDRDRFVLSAGHGSMLLYSLLYMAGYDISLEDIKGFRQLGSKTAGHPEYGLASGIETTTGPLGQGLANAVGMAMAEKMLAVRFNTQNHTVIDHYTYVIAGDGCMMEGVASEAASLAGHLGLGKLIVFYDSNRISIEGSTALSFTEDVAARFRAYGWHVQEGDAYDTDGILSMAREAKRVDDRPSLIVLASTIARGSVNMAGSHQTHGAPLGEDEVKATKKALGIPQGDSFYVHPDAFAFFDKRRKEWDSVYSSWKVEFDQWAKENTELYEEWQRYFGEVNVDDLDFPQFGVGDRIATRSAGGKILNAVAEAVPNLVGGAADLAPSTKTSLSGMGDFQRESYGGKNFHFGVREHGMGAIVNGIALHGGFRPFCSTFFVFTDYMRPPIRLAAMMKLPVIYVFTHDSIFVGEDGPTHQPVEHLAAMRAIPNLLVLRPADAEETVMAWKIALQNRSGPTALVLTRQNLEVFSKQDKSWKENIRKGAYIVCDTDGEPDVVVVATGSEVSLALGAVQGMKDSGVRVVSMISRELFLDQSQEFRDTLIPPGVKRLVIEAGVSFGWEGIAGADGSIIAVDRFGESGPAKDVSQHLGLGVQSVVEEIKKLKA
jgi:transketolase